MEKEKFVQFRPVSEEDKIALGVFKSSSDEMYLYSSGYFDTSYPYIVCEGCHAEILCRPGDLGHLLDELEDIRCPGCGRKTLAFHSKVKYLIPALADLVEIRKKKEEGHCNLDEEE